MNSTKATWLLLAALAVLTLPALTAQTSRAASSAPGLYGAGIAPSSGAVLDVPLPRPYPDVPLPRP